MTGLVVALRATLVTLVLTGLAYPLVVTGLAQVMFPHRANGSIVLDDKGHAIGSELIGQGFADPAYLHARPSASKYDAASSAGTNFAVTSKKLRDEATALTAAYRAENGLPEGSPVPADAVTRSASGIDPQISPDNAWLQAPRIAKARGVAVDRVRAVIADHVDSRELGFLGEERAPVLEINLALDRQFGRPPRLATGGGTLGP